MRKLARSHSTTELLPLNLTILQHDHVDCQFYCADKALRAPRLFPPHIAAYASSTSTFLAARSSFTILKLRTCPARAGSALGGPPLPVFQRACSIELSDDRSAFAGACVSLLAAAAELTLHVA